MTIASLTIAAILSYLTGRHRRTAALDTEQLEIAAGWAQIGDEHQDIAAEWRNIAEAREDMQRTYRALLEEAGIEGLLS